MIYDIKAKFFISFSISFYHHFNSFKFDILSSMLEHSEIIAPLHKALEKMVSSLITLPQIEENYKKLKEIKNYDRHERRYLFQQQKRGQNFEQTSESDSEPDENYKNLDQDQLNYLIRKKLVKLKYAPSSAAEISEACIQQAQCKPLEDVQIDSITDVYQNEMVEAPGMGGQKKMNEVNLVWEEDQIKHKNLKALKFIIEQLEKIGNEKSEY